MRRVDNLFTWHIHNSVGHSGRSVLQRRRQNIFGGVIVFFDDFGQNVSGDAMFGGKLV